MILSGISTSNNEHTTILKTELSHQFTVLGSLKIEDKVSSVNMIDDLTILISANQCFKLVNINSMTVIKSLVINCSIHNTIITEDRIVNISDNGRIDIFKYFD